LLDEAVEAAERVDPRARHDGFTPGVDAAGRRMLNATSPTTKAARRRLASLEAGESQLIPASSISLRQFPDAAAVPFLGLRVHDTPEEHDESAWLIRVFADDRVGVGQNYAQMQEQTRLVSEGFTVGRIDDNGDYIPRGLNPETGQASGRTSAPATLSRPPR
jgi:hypothetical protein